MASLGSASKRKLICLAGFMGCGKTTIGQRLARQLGWRFVDLDTGIEERAGLPITEIFERLGEPVFRQMEHEQLLEALGRAAEQDVPTVLALGGGTFAQPPNMTLLKQNGGPVIWLDCPVEKLLERCVTMSDRPLFRDEASFRKLYEQRRPFYQQADYRVPSNAEPRVVIKRILALGILDPLLNVSDASRGSLNA